MDQQIPPGWSVRDEPLTGTFTLTNDYTFIFQGLSAIEVRNAIIKHWEHSKGVSSNEQHRQSNQAPRSAAAAQQAAGNSGGAAQGSVTIITGTSVSKAGTGAISPQQSAGLNHIGQVAQAAYQRAVAAQISAKIKADIEKNKVNPLPRSEPRIGELIGHRAWRVVNGRLYSTAHSCAWDPIVPMMDSLLRGREISDHNNSGVWAFKDPFTMAKQFWGTAVFGTIWMWGTVIEHQQGYRSQYAAVRSLDYICPTVAVSLDALRQTYGVSEHPKCQYCGVERPD